jgi:hypothetical protein
MFFFSQTFALLLIPFLTFSSVACDPSPRTNPPYPTIPCGIAADVRFTDTFTLSRVDSNDSIPLRRSGFVWSRDKVFISFCSSYLLLTHSLPFTSWITVLIILSEILQEPNKFHCWCYNGWLYPVDETCRVTHISQNICHYRNRVACGILHRHYRF